MKKYQLVVIPDWLGSANKNGVELGPDALEETILSNNIKGKLSKSIKIKLPEHNPKNFNKEIKYLPEIKKMSFDIKEKIILMKDTPIALIGDDSSLIGILAGIANKFGDNYGLIYIDAHGDINTPETSPSGKIFGMVMSHLIGIGNKDLIEVNGGIPSLKKENIIMIGQGL